MHGIDEWNVGPAGAASESWTIDLAIDRSRKGGITLKLDNFDWIRSTIFVHACKGN